MSLLSEKSRRLALRAAGASLLALGAAAPLLAQSTPDAAADDGEIVVTATRRAENIKDVPVAVTAIGGEKLAVLNSSGLDIRFLSSRTPSLQIESSFGRTFPRFYIRGLGNTDFDPNAAQPVSVVYDDVALESPMLKSFPVFDLASVEVLRGPQGTLFGRNTPAGVIKLNSAKPSDSFGGYGSVSWGTYNTVNAEAALTGPLGEGLSFRASGLLQRRDDWVKNDSSPTLADRRLEGYRDLAGRVQLGYTSGDFNALFNVHGRDLEASPRVFRAGLFQQGSNRFSPGFDKDHVTLDGLTSQSLKQFGANARLDYRADGLGTFYSTTAYERANVQSTGDIDGGAAYGFPALGLGVALFPVNTGGRTKPKEFSQEFRFASEDMDGFRFQAGAYYFHQKLDYAEYAYDGTGTRVSAILHDNKNENYGLFASGEYKASEALTLRAGVRYSHDKKRDTISLDPALAASSTASQVILVPLPLTNQAKASNISWDASATYKLSDQISVYARFATGYLGPAIQDRVTFGSVPSVAGKQTTISGEAGLKGATGDGTLQFDLDGYWYRTKDLQLTAVGGATNSAQLLNADKAIGYGVEGTVEFRPMPQLSLTAGASWNFTEIRDPNIAVAPCGSLCTVTDPLNGAGLALIDGNDLPQAPRYVANATARYAIPVGSGEVFAFTDWAYRSSINYFLYTAREFRGRSLIEGGLKLGYKSDGGWEAAVFARNITNQIRSISAIDFNNLTGMINEPRIIGVELKASF
ncbi:MULTISPECIES: TonB-dependent receptor [unclassified Sphingomonas]|uniref:TonB-dependent receptor n=1 Tax=unclassified Sphingomonas TaxID=196159 RepID=UPI0006FAEA24|nr:MULTISPECIES: TonB-dependent receptor [unclassified Sphingomonas]KQX20008.1 TonB-dependent receptor [Sphingomonas sp. Root1294]KQY67257.1 TonB-dependent receptor [Sphingomonas sp. Root50]KRB90631.1 TonB-dependent receptor [Sphingomonas sp. Root720]